MVNYYNNVICPKSIYTAYKSVYCVRAAAVRTKSKKKKLAIWNVAMVLVCLCSSARSSLHNLKWNTLSLKHKWVKLTSFWHFHYELLKVLSCHTCKFTVSLIKHKFIFNLSGIYRILSNIGDNYMKIEWITVAVCVVYVLNTDRSLSDCFFSFSLSAPHIVCTPSKKCQGCTASFKITQCTCLSTCLFVPPCQYLSVCLPLCFICLSISVCLSICRLLRPPRCPSVCCHLSVCDMNPPVHC